MATIKHQKGILILTPFFSPNIGGTENQLDDLVTFLDSQNYQVFVHTYSPLTTTTQWLKYESRGKNIKIWRYGWYGHDLFHRVEKYPIIDFLYLTPYLFLRTLLWLLINHKKINTIHAQGLNASLCGVIFKKLFHKKLVTSIHSVYEINPRSLTAKLTGKILNLSDEILATSEKSLDELRSFNVCRPKMGVFIPWINLDIFKPTNKNDARKILNLEDKFTVLFLSRLIRKKGARVLAKVARQLPDINFVFGGIGPDAEFLSKQQDKYKNIKFVGTIDHSQIPLYYSMADIYCFPTQYEEGFGKVLAESLACGTPIITSNKGAIPKVVDDSVAILADPTVAKLKSAILKLYKNPAELSRLRQNTTKFALRKYGPDNGFIISNCY